MQGLADAAADHLQTAKTFLANPQASPSDTVFLKDTRRTRPGEGSMAVVAGASPGTGHPGRGGGGARRGRRQAPCKAANHGLSAVNLEALIADLVSRQSLPRPAQGAGRAGRDGMAARGVLEATAEEVASWLVQELGHRRYVDDTYSICYFMWQFHELSSSCACCQGVLSPISAEVACHLAAILSAMRFHVAATVAAMRFPREAFGNQHLLVATVDMP